VPRPISITIGVVLCGLLFSVNRSHAEAPPSTQPDSAAFRQWITQLADADPDVRDSATQQLMSLKRDDLPALRQAAMSQRPLLPVQIASLRDVVRQVYLASEPYKPMRDVAFLGLSWQGAEFRDSGDVGVVVADRIPGFDAYRCLRNGDVIVKLLDNPDAPLHNPSQLRDTVRVLGPGRILRFEVLRDGRPVVVSVLLQARPLELPDLSDPREWIKERADRADKYWESNFSVLDRDVAATDAAAASAP
jgi:hypothetical protein